jgi:branched-chain amino acid transport system permease protein
MNSTRIAAVLGAIAFAAALPLVVDRYTLVLLLPFFGYAIALLGLNLLFGYTGLLSFGHAMFLGIGAYAAATLTSKFHVQHFELILLAAIAGAALVGLVIGSLCVRYTKIFFGMLTLAFSMLFHSFLFKFYTLTGGDEGIKVLRPRLLGYDFAAWNKIAFLTGPFYYYCLVIAALLAFVMWRLVNSPFGLHLQAVRDNERKAEYLGVSVYRLRLIAFTISGIYGAVGGAILGVNSGIADPEIAYWLQSGNLVFMTVLGGFTNFFGPPLGALAFIFLQDRLMSATEYWRLALGVVLVCIVLFFPRGIVGLLDGVRRNVRVARASLREAKA